MKVHGTKYKVTERRCFEGMAAFNQRCIQTDIPLPGGQTGKSNTCFCTSELCNTASFPVHGSVLTLFISIAAILLQTMI